ncbi:MAG TPA: 1-(5-phosphoribosyl)-5-[(5-phosphoribosylamino)methylideneamino]imidazole-4-carboxamide isomerase [Bacteroidales bacterium]|jgi:phosphoribosylformimino-5-aminoimidazole carboxamide ribotide isomerase|nr:1-(5-phosphoribosyl)-5-[(5-phosphoribosylamino)methylideneamino]imidazole-4-carboxamide isomerase [Bacteroidales bacterium]
MIEIIPAIDIIEGKCVRLTQGDYMQKTIYNEDPLEVAKSFADIGITRLHLVDLDGAKAKHIVNWKVLENIAKKTSLVIDFGGGLKSDDDLRIAFECGAQMITGGSIAVKDQNTFTGWISKFGADKIILGADVKNNNIAISGWEEDSGINILEFVEGYVKKGITKVISTDISKDGMLEGPSFELYQDLRQNFENLYVIASGGVSSMDDIIQLEEKGIPAVITGKAIYEGKITLKQIQTFYK